jgi:hypothetical protein
LAIAEVASVSKKANMDLIMVSQQAEWLG